MITGTEIYWITRLDYFQTAAIGLGIVFLAVTFFCFLISIADDEIIERLKITLLLFFLSLVFFIGGLFIPDTKEMCAIKVLPAIINNENVQELPNKVVDLANEWLEELKPSKEE